MSVLDVQIPTTGIIPNTSNLGVGLTQQLPVQIYINTNDTLSVVLTPNYLNQAATYFQYPFNNYQMALVMTSDEGPTWCRVLKVVNSSGTGYNYSLEEVGAPGTVNLPTVANQITYAVSPGGALAAAGLSTALFNAGNISAGKSGTAGELLSYPSAATTGSLGLKAVANSGNYANVISNASTAQATTWSIPDPGTSATTFILADSAGTQTIATGNLTITNNLTVNGTLSYSSLTVATGSATAPSYTFTGRTNTGMYSSGANTVDFTTDSTRQLSIGGTIVAVNYLQIQGSVASSPVLINALGTDTNIGIKVTPKGTGSLENAVGALATPSYSFVGRLDTGMFSSAASTLDFTSTGGENLQIVDSGGTSVNYVTIQGQVTTSAPVLGATGSDANVGLALTYKGTGALQNAVGAVGTPSYSFAGRLDTGMWSSAAHTLDFSTNSLRALQLVSSPALSVNYLTITASATGVNPIIAAAGTDTNITLSVTPKGNGGLTLTTGTFTATTGSIVATAGNVTAGSSGHAGVVTSFPSAATEGSLILAAVSNAGGNFTTTISNASSVGQSQVISIPDSGVATSSFLLADSAGGQTISTGGLTVTSGNISITTGLFEAPVGSAAAPSYTFNARTNTGIYSSAASTLDFAADGTRHMEVGGAIVAVNYLQVQGSTTGNPVLLNALGSDTDIGFTLTPKGAGNAILATGNFTATTGSITAGSSGHAGTVTSFPGTASNGKLVLAAVNNAGNHTTTISSVAGLGQDEVITIPDVGAATGNFLAAGAALVSGNLIQASGTAGAVVDSGIAVATGLTQVAQGTISAASFHTMYDTPIQLIAAPGSGFGIIVLTAYLELVFAAAAPAGGGNIIFQYGNTVHGGGVNTIINGGTLVISSSFATGASVTQWTTLCNGANIATTATSTTTNLGVFLSNASADFTANGGTSSLKWSISYMVVPM